MAEDNASTRRDFAAVVESLLYDIVRDAYGLRAPGAGVDMLGRAHAAVWRSALEARQPQVFRDAQHLRTHYQRARLSATILEDIDNAIVAELAHVAGARYASSRRSMQAFTHIITQVTRDVSKAQLLAWFEAAVQGEDDDAPAQDRRVA